MLKMDLTLRDTEMFSAEKEPMWFFQTKKLVGDIDQDIVAMLDEEELGVNIRDSPTVIICPNSSECQLITEKLQGSGLAAIDFSKIPAVDNPGVVKKMKLLVTDVRSASKITRPDIRCVIHYGSPYEIDEYYRQVANIAGRDGKLTVCMMYYSPLDFEGLCSKDDLVIYVGLNGFETIYIMSRFSGNTKFLSNIDIDSECKIKIGSISKNAVEINNMQFNVLESFAENLDSVEEELNLPLRTPGHRNTFTFPYSLNEDEKQNFENKFKALSMEQLELKNNLINATAHSCPDPSEPPKKQIKLEDEQDDDKKEEHDEAWFLNPALRKTDPKKFVVTIPRFIINPDSN